MTNFKTFLFSYFRMCQSKLILHLSLPTSGHNMLNQFPSGSNSTKYGYKIQFYVQTMVLFGQIGVTAIYLMSYQPNLLILGQTRLLGGRKQLKVRQIRFKWLRIWFKYVKPNFQWVNYHTMWIKVGQTMVSFGQIGVTVGLSDVTLAKIGQSRSNQVPRGQ